MTKVCLYCRRQFTAIRKDQCFCSQKCRQKSYYIPKPKCSDCPMKSCIFRNTKRKYAPKDCPERQ